MKTRHYCISLLAIVLLIIGSGFAFELIPDNLTPTELTKLFYKFPKIDTIGHFISFFLLTWLVNSLLKVPMVQSVLVLFFYAILTEVGQYHLLFRSAELTDVLADTVGIFTFIFIKLTYLRLIKVKSQHIKQH